MTVDFKNIIAALILMLLTQYTICVDLGLRESLMFFGAVINFSNGMVQLEIGRPWVFQNHLIF